MILRATVIAVLAVSVLLFFFQHQLIWLPHHYPSTYRQLLPKGAAEFEFKTSEGRQSAFYIPPRDAGAVVSPARIWVVFCGNGSVALDWLDFVAGDPNWNDGFLLIDYPGYGRCEGSAAPASIAESSDAALAELAKHLNTSVQDLEPKLNVLAHSIGCAAGLEFAVRHPARRIVLLSPFTSLRDMARRTVGWPLCWILRHNFDNRARLSELTARPGPPRITIFHGTDDTLIPIEMGRTLAAMYPKITTFYEVPGATHNSIVGDAETQVFSAMNQ